MAHGICNSVIYMAIYECKCPGAHTVRIYLNHNPFHPTLSAGLSDAHVGILYQAH